MVARSPDCCLPAFFPHTGLANFPYQHTGFIWIHMHEIDTNPLMILF